MHHSSAMTGRLRSLLLLTAGILLAIAALVAVPDLRHALLRRAGWLLVASDTGRAADVIVIATDADGAGVLEAVDLVHAGLASRVAVFADPPDAVDEEFLRRGVPYFDAAAISTQQLHSLGVKDVVRIPRSVAGTQDEGKVLPEWCDRQGYRTIIFISTADHSRRVRRVLSRAMAGHAAQVLVRYSRYSDFNPDQWWSARGTIRTEIVETEKLLLDFILHPLS